MGSFLRDALAKMNPLLSNLIKSYHHIEKQKRDQDGYEDAKGTNNHTEERVNIAERVEAGESSHAIAEALGRPLPTVRKWRQRYLQEGRGTGPDGRRDERRPTGNAGRTSRLGSANVTVGNWEGRTFCGSKDAQGGRRWTRWAKYHYFPVKLGKFSLCARNQSGYPVSKEQH